MYKHGEGIGLYFIAILPPLELVNELQKIKLDIQEKYGSKKAQNGPAHITLQPPFKWEEERVGEVTSLLEELAKGVNFFPVHLNGFGHFEYYTVFVDVEKNKEIEKLFYKLQPMLINQLQLKKTVLRRNTIHPHLTIASRDIKKKFPAIWKEYKNKQYENSFMANSVSLFKHNGKTWDVFQTIEFMP